MNDKYGYLTLKKSLETIASNLIKEGQLELANELLRTSKFYVGMPSEFMGESWLAIRKVLENKIKISNETFILSECVYKQIVEGFNRVGQKLPK